MQEIRAVGEQVLQTIASAASPALVDAAPSEHRASRSALADAAPLEPPAPVEQPADGSEAASERSSHQPTGESLALCEFFPAAPSLGTGLANALL